MDPSIDIPSLINSSNPDYTSDINCDNYTINNCMINDINIENIIKIEEDYLDRSDIKSYLNLVNFYKRNTKSDMSISDSKITLSAEFKNLRDILYAELKKKPYFNKLGLILNVKNPDKLLKIIYDVIFDPYSVGAVYNNTSFFEHTFVGEYDEKNFKGQHQIISFSLYQNDQIEKLKSLMESPNKNQKDINSILAVLNYSCNTNKISENNHHLFFKYTDPIDNKTTNITSFITGFNPLLDICIYTYISVYIRRQKPHSDVYQPKPKFNKDNKPTNLINFEYDNKKFSYKYHFFKNKLRTCYLLF